MTRIFVSYARVDIYLVRQLVTILEAGGHEAWFDHRLLPGQDWKEQLRGGIYNCDAFVYALTPESIASEWCRWEFARAIEMGKPIIPVLFQANTVLPDLLSCTQYVDFSQGPTPEATARLMNGLWNLAVRIPSHAASKDSFWPRGFPSRVPDEVISAYRTDTHTKKPKKSSARNTTSAGEAPTRIPTPTPPPAHIEPPPPPAPKRARSAKKTSSRPASSPSKRRRLTGLMVGVLFAAFVIAAVGYALLDDIHSPVDAAAKNTPSPEAILVVSSATPPGISAASEDCPGAQPSRLQIGARALIPFEMGDLFRLVVRAAPGLTSPSVDRLYSGMQFQVVEGPTCADWMTWWHVRSDEGIEGWVAESDRDGYYMKPLY